VLDRQKLETILLKRFRSATAGEVAAAANAIMGLAHHPAPRHASLNNTGRPLLPVSPQTTIGVSRLIAAPVNRVFDACTDLERGAELASGIIRIEALTQGAFGLGTCWRESRRVLGCIETAEMEVTEFEPYQSYTISHFKGGIHVETAFSFESVADGTLVTISFALNEWSLPVGSLSPVAWAIAGKVRHALDADLADLQKAMKLDQFELVPESRQLRGT